MKNMKQHITVEQLGGLSEKGKKRWYGFMEKQWGKEMKYWNRVAKERGSKYEVVSKIRDMHDLCGSIGQMIEFLDEKGALDFGIDRLKDGTWAVNFMSDTYEHRSKQLCDALWEAVKETLNEQG